MFKLRHGQEITSEVINNIINELNQLAAEHAGVIDDKKETVKKLESFKTTLDELDTKFNTKLSGLPNFVELVETYYSQLNDGVNFEYKSATTDDTGGILPLYKTDFLLFNDESLCAQYRSEHNPPQNIKTLLIDTQPRIIWFYDLPHLTWISLSADANRQAIETTIPAITIVEDTESPDYGKWKIGDTVTSISALGQEGTPGQAGPIGPVGPKGDRGLQGLTGPQGLKGNDGRTIAVIAGSCNDQFGSGFIQNDYTQPYLYIKFYYSDASQAEIDAIRPIIIKTKGIAYVPYIEDGKLYFSINTNLSNTSEGYNILGQKGDKGDKGDPPSLYFAYEDSEGETKKIFPKPAPAGSGYDYVFEAEQFIGPKGEQGIQGEIGPRGSDGVGITNIEVSHSTTDRVTKISISTSDSGYKYFEIPDGRDGVDGRDGIDGRDGAPGLNGLDGRDGQDGRNGSDGIGIRAITTDQVTNPGYTKVSVELTNANKTEFNIPDGRKGDKGDTGTAGTNGTDGKDGVSITNVVSTYSPEHTDYELIITKSDGSVFRVPIPLGPQGLQGPKGEKGEDGTSLEILGSVNTKADLPSSATAGDCYIVLTDESRDPVEYGVLYYKNDTGWQYCGQIKGPKGDTGETGETGATGSPGRGITSIAKSATAGAVDTYTITYSDNSTSTFTVTNGSNGANGIAPHIGTNGNWYIGSEDTGVHAEGPKGDTGETGQGLTIKASQSEATAVGDCYIDASGNLQLRVATTGSNQWRNCGQIKGPAGADGKQVQIQKTENVIQWKYNTDTQWTTLVQLSDLKGEDGEQGEQGEQGDTGRGIAEIQTAEIPGGHSITIIYDDDTEGPTISILNGVDGSAGPQGASVQLIDSGTLPDPTSYSVNDVVILGTGTNKGNIYRLSVATGGTKSWTLLSTKFEGTPGEDGARGSRFFKANTVQLTQESTEVAKLYITTPEDVSPKDILIDNKSQMFMVDAINTTTFTIHFLVVAQGAQGPQGERGKSIHYVSSASAPARVDTNSYKVGDSVICITDSVARIYVVATVTPYSASEDEITYSDSHSIRGADGKDIIFVDVLPSQNINPNALYIVRSPNADFGIGPMYVAKRNSTNTSWEYPLKFDNLIEIDNDTPLTFDPNLPQCIKKGPHYSGGTNVTLNGIDKTAAKIGIYAPTSSGNSGQILNSQGTNAAPTWITNYGPTAAGSAGYVWEGNGTSAQPSWKQPFITNVNGSTTRGKSVYAPITSGSLGQFLISNGNGIAPSWASLYSILQTTGFGEYNSQGVLLFAGNENITTTVDRYTQELALGEMAIQTCVVSGSGKLRIKTPKKNNSSDNAFYKYILFYCSNGSGSIGSISGARNGGVQKGENVISTWASDNYITAGANGEYTSVVCLTIRIE